MPQDQVVTTYTYDELDSSAQDVARRNYVANMDVSDEVADFFRNDLENWGLDGLTVYWGLGHVQGDGVTFSGPINLDALIGAREYGGLGGEQASYYDTSEYNRVCELVKELREMGAELSASYHTEGSGIGTTYANVDYAFDKYDDLKVSEKSQELQEALTDLARNVVGPRFMRMGYDEIDFMQSDEEVGRILRESDKVFTRDGEEFTLGSRIDPPGQSL